MLIFPPGLIRIVCRIFGHDVVDNSEISLGVIIRGRYRKTDMLLLRGGLLIFLLNLMVLPGCKQVSPISKPRTSSAASIPFPGYERLSDEDRVRADSLLAYALDHEALYSLMADIKPISSIGMALSYPIGKDSTQRDGEQEVVPVTVDSIQAHLRELESWNRVLENYRSMRPSFLNPQGQLEAVKLYRTWWNRERK